MSSSREVYTSDSEEGLAGVEKIVGGIDEVAVLINVTKRPLGVAPVWHKTAKLESAASTSRSSQAELRILRGEHDVSIFWQDMAS